MAKKKTFEDSYAGLAEAAEALKNDGISLEESIRLVESATKHYEACKEILSEARNRLLILDKDSETVRAADEKNGISGSDTDE